MSKIEAYGIKFDNEFEKEFYEYLTSKCIPFQYHKKVNLIEKSEYGKAIDWNIDFYIESLDIYIDIKGLNKTITYEKLKKRLFKEKYGDKIFFIAESPVWYQKEFGKKYVEYEVKNKIEIVIRRFKDKIGLFKIVKDKKRYGTIKAARHGKELAEMCIEKDLLPFDKI